MSEQKKSGRNALPVAEEVGPQIVGRTPDADARQLEQLHEHQLAVVETYGDGLPWHPDHYEAAIRSELRRGCEAFLKAGSYLLVARECAAHGEFGGLLERLGIAPRQAQRMMEAARRIASLPNATRATHLIEVTGSQSKLIELLSLPEEQFEELAETGKTAGVSLDDVEEMTRDELRAAIRDARADIEAKNARISQLSENLNREHERTSKAQRKWQSATVDEQQLILEHAVTDAEAAIVADLGNKDAGLLAAVAALGNHCADNNLDCTEFLGDVFGRLLNAVRKIRDHDSLAVVVPIVHDAGMEG